eukprot:c55741_g1_i1 orf=57-287(+)
MVGRSQSLEREGSWLEEGFPPLTKKPSKQATTTQEVVRRRRADQDVVGEGGHTGIVASVDYAMNNVLNMQNVEKMS